MKRLGIALRMSLGGAICGGYLGIIAGAIGGALYGLAVGDLSHGLMGAMIGGSVAALAGAVLGMIVGVDEARKKTPLHSDTPVSSGSSHS